MATKRLLKRRKYTYNLERDGVTQGLLMRFLACRISAKHYLNLLTPIKTKTILDYGSAWHGVVNVWKQYALQHYGKLPKKRGARSDLLLTMGQQYLQDYRKKHSALSVNPQEFETRMGQVEYLMKHYLYALEGSDFYLDLDFFKRKWLETERLFEVPFRGFKLRGRRDGIFQHNGNWLRETKTSSQISEEELGLLLPLNFQVKFYTVAAEEEYGIKLDGCCYNMIRRSLHKSHETFIAAVEKDPQYFFERYEIVFTRQEIEDFKDELEHILFDFAEWVNGEMFTYRGYGACAGRKWKCDFLPLCSQDRMELYTTRKHLFRELVEEKGGVA